MSIDPFGAFATPSSSDASGTNARSLFCTATSFPRRTYHR
jgi:hypothetical protein